MTMYYNFFLRRKLKALLDKKDNVYTLTTISEAIEGLLTEYEAHPEQSPEGKRNFFTALLEKASKFYDEQIYQHKPWWKKIFYFFGWLPKEESRVVSLIEDIKNRIRSIQKAEDSFDNFIVKFGISMIAETAKAAVLKHYDELSTDLKQRLRYLSHRTLTDVLMVPKALEGNIVYIAYKEYKQDFDEFIKSLPKDIKESKRLTGFIKQLAHCEDHEQSMTLEKTRLQTIKNVLKESLDERPMQLFEDELVQNQTFKVLDAIATMKVNEQMLFPHGYTYKTGGHATVFYVEKINDDQVVFYFVNTGIGSQEIESWKTSFKNFISHSNTSPIKVTSPMNFKELAESNLIQKLIAPNIVDSTDQQSAVHAMIEPLVNLYQQNMLHDDKRTMRHQTMGSCSQSCIDAWLETQLNETELVQFQIFRLNKSIKEIDNLLKYTKLDATQQGYCMSMRIAAYASLEKINKRLSFLITGFEHQDKERVAILMSTRKENSAYKGKAPKELPLDRIEDYSQRKIDGNRVKSKFSQCEQEKINAHTSKTPIDIKRKEVETHLINRLSLGFFGNKVETQLTQEERKHNKVAKVLLAKNILEGRQQIREVEGLRRDLKFNALSSKELERVQLLTTGEGQNKICYPYLDVRKPGSLWEILEQQSSSDHLKNASERVSSTFTPPLLGS